MEGGREGGRKKGKEGGREGEGCQGGRERVVREWDKHEEVCRNNQLTSTGLSLSTSQCYPPPRLK